MLGNSQIRWLPLRLNIIPLIDKQVKYIYQQYLTTRKDILEGDILAVQIYNHITQKAQQRIQEIDRFYVIYPMDSRMKFIYASRSILSKMVENKNQFQKISDHQKNQENLFQQSNNNKTWAQHYQNGSSLQMKMQNSKQKLNVSMPNNNYTMKSQLNHKEESKVSQNPTQNQMVRLSDLSHQYQKRKSPIKTKVKEQLKDLKKGSSRKTQVGAKKLISNKKIQQVLQLQRQKIAAQSRFDQNPQEIKQSFKDLSQLVFTIKMTKEEYNEFIRLKRKNNHA